MDNKAIDLSKYSDEELFQEISFHVCEIESYKKMVEVSSRRRRSVR